MGYGPITEEQFSKALDRLGERDVVKLVRAGAFDGDEAVWAAAWLRGERPAPKPAPAPAPAPVVLLEREEPRPAEAPASSNPFSSLFRTRAA